MRRHLILTKLVIPKTGSPQPLRENPEQHRRPAARSQPNASESEPPVRPRVRVELAPRASTSINWVSSARSLPFSRLICCFPYLRRLMCCFPYRSTYSVPFVFPIPLLIFSFPSWLFLIFPPAASRGQHRASSRATAGACCCSLFR